MKEYGEKMSFSLMDPDLVITFNYILLRHTGTSEFYTI